MKHPQPVSAPLDASALMATLAAVPLPLVVISAQGYIDWVNGPAGDLFGHAIAGLKYMSPMRQPGLVHAIETCLRDGEAQECVFLHSVAQGEARFRAVCTPGPDLAGRPGGVLLSLEDVGQIEDASQMRQDFVANVSHELRMPVTALLGFIETLRGAARDDAPARERFLGIMEREAARMGRLVSDLLALSRLEAMERTRPTAHVDIAALANSCIQTLAPLATELNASVRANVPMGAVLVLGDSDQLQQVFTNLLENALKYGAPDDVPDDVPDGATGARVGARVGVEISTGEGKARIIVRDAGPGIAPLHLPRLTERFYRIDGHRSRQLGGTGLGLAIVKHIVNRHRGRLRITSIPGQGSAFCVTLPLVDAPA